MRFFVVEPCRNGTLGETATFERAATGAGERRREADQAWRPDNERHLLSERWWWTSSVRGHRLASGDVSMYAG